MKEIELTRGFVALVDDEDYDKPMPQRWCVKISTYTQYAIRRLWNKGDKVYVHQYMHRLILDIAETEIQVDHINGNGLDNRRANLRACSKSQNAMNKFKRRGSSVFKGVRFNKKDKRWESFLTFNGKQKYLGQFVNEVDAALRYNVEALLVFGEFARLNHVNGS